MLLLEFLTEIFPCSCNRQTNVISVVLIITIKTCQEWYNLSDGFKFLFFCPNLGRYFRVNSQAQLVHKDFESMIDESNQMSISLITAFQRLFVNPIIINKIFISTGEIRYASKRQIHADINHRRNAWICTFFQLPVIEHVGLR